MSNLWDQSRTQPETSVVMPGETIPASDVLANCDVSAIADEVRRHASVTLQFPKWTDGRAYTQARLLRARYRPRALLRQAWQTLRQGAAPIYIDEILDGPSMPIPGLPGEAGEGGDGEGGDAEQDPLYDEAVNFVLESRRASISAVQRKLKIGYNRAARMVEAMEMAGVVTSMNTNGSREVIAPSPVRD